MLQRARIDRADRRPGGQVDLVAVGRVDLRDQAAVGDGRRLAEGKAPTMPRDHRFQRVEAVGDPALRPFEDAGLIDAQLAERAADAGVVQRMDIAGDDQRHGADPRAVERARGQQGRLGEGLLQPFQDRQALGQDLAVADLQRRGQPLRIERPVGGLTLLALDQVDGDGRIGHALQRQADPRAIGRPGAPGAVQHIAHQTTVKLSAPTPSTSPATTSPRTSGPTPSGVPV